MTYLAGVWNWIVSHPLTDNEPIPRDDLNSLKKLAAEGTPEEEKICLGIMLDTY
jgi:hypothetical protein